MKTNVEPWRAQSALMRYRLPHFTYLRLGQCQEEEENGTQLPVEWEPEAALDQCAEERILEAHYQLMNHSATFSKATKAPTHVQYMTHLSKSGSDNGLWESAFQVE